ncbi:MAG: amidohydrolase family protein [Halobacteria archaeon]
MRERKAMDGLKKSRIRKGRRDFLKGMAAVAGVSGLAGCQAVRRTSNSTLKGRVVKGPDMEVIKGRVEVRDGKIDEVVEEGVESDDIILPSFVNTHTHITDSVAKERARNYNWTELFVSPDKKHEFIREHTRHERRSAMKGTMEYMNEGGTAAFVDFTEMGVAGVSDLKHASNGTELEPFPLLTKPDLQGYKDLASEIQKASGFTDYYPYDEVTVRGAEICREEGLLFPLHAGESSTQDIDAAFELDPTYLVHMVQARGKDFEKLDKTGIPVSVAPRSNLVILGEKPPMERLDGVTTVALGTDNVMLNSPSMWREMEFTSKLYDLPPEKVLRMATANAAELAGISDRMGTIEEGKEAKITVLSGTGELLDLPMEETVAGITRRATGREVKQVIR